VLIHPGNPKRSHREPYVGLGGTALVYISEPWSFLPDQSPMADVYFYDAPSKENRLLTVGEGGEPHNGFGSNPILVQEAGLVLFTSNATNLLPGQNSPYRQVYLFDLKSGVTTLISKNKDQAVSRRLFGHRPIGRVITQRLLLPVASSLSKPPPPILSGSFRWNL
jgi:hypothetical protein